MGLEFNLNRPPVSDEEVDKKKDFDALVRKFKEQSLKQAQGDESWRKNKTIRYTTIIAGVTVVCTVTLLSLLQSSKKTSNTKANETINTPAPSKKTTTNYVSAPSAKLRTPYSTYKIQAGKASNLTHSTKSRISVPANSLVNKEGKQIVGEVTLEYREMHDIADVISNGVPMKYDSAGTSYCLETAGMFDIRATQNGEPVFVKPGNTITVELASANTQDRFNQYYLDTVQGNWLYLKRDDLLKSSASVKISSVKSEKLQQLRNEIDVVIPTRIDSVSEHYTRVASALPKPAEPTKPEKATGKRPEFVLDASTDDFPELKAYENTVFEVGVENKNYSKELHSITWSDVRLLPGPDRGKNYWLALTYRSRSEKLVVYPVLKGADYAKAESRYETQYADYQARLEDRKNKEQRLMQELQAKQEKYLAEQKRKEAEFQKEQRRLIEESRTNEVRQMTAGFNSAGENSKVERVFRIAQFGIFNSDCPHAIPGSSFLQPLFMTAKDEKIVVPQRIFLINHQAKTVVGYEGFANSIPYEEGNTSYSFCIFRAGKAYHCSRSEFSSALANGARKFIVKPLPDNAENPEDFKRFLEL